MKDKETLSFIFYTNAALERKCTLLLYLIFKRTNESSHQ